MRQWTLTALSALAAAVLAVAGSQLLGSPPAAYPTAVLAQPPAPLASSLERTLAQLPPLLRGVPVRPVPPLAPYGTTCEVAGASCSITPCVEFARSAVPVADAPTPAADTSRAAVLRVAPTVGRGLPPPGRPSCRGRLGAPKILRVSGP